MMVSSKFLPGVVALAALVAMACGSTPMSPTSSASGLRAPFVLPGLAVALAAGPAQAISGGGGGVSGGGGTGGGGGTALPDIQLTGSASTDKPAPGATYSYTFQAKNGGAATAPGVSFQTVLPVELPPASFQRVTNSDGSACTANFVDAQVYIGCGLGDLAVGAQKTITIVVSAPAALVTFGTLATAYPSDVLTNPLADKNLGDNAKTITVTVR